MFASGTEGKEESTIVDGTNCDACDSPFLDYREVELAHIESKGSGGWKRDDRLRNLRLLQSETNSDCGSRNLIDYISDIRKARKKFPCEVP